MKKLNLTGQRFGKLIALIKIARLIIYLGKFQTIV